VKFERDPVTGAVTHEVKKDLHEYYRAIENSPALVGRVKCSDRLHNLKTIQVFTRDRKIRYLSETIEFVLPLAWAIDQWARDPKQRFYDDLALHVDRIQKEIGEALSASELRNIEVDEFELLSQVTGDCWGV
jgi:(p)ppGpp synthase/HD superfamily hydrolase